MKITNYLFLTVFLSMLLASCEHDERDDLIASEDSNFETYYGGTFEIPVSASGGDWYISKIVAVTNKGGEVIKDKGQRPLALVGHGKKEADNGWLAIERENDYEFMIHLEECFGTQDRSFVVMLTDDDQTASVFCIQNSGKYKLVKTEYQEIEELRRIYTSDEGCRNMTLTNNTSQKVWVPLDEVFENVVYSSQYESNSYGAFDWMPEEGVKLSSPDLIIDGVLKWTPNSCYQSGVTTTAFTDYKKNEILLEPHSSVAVQGAVNYCKRVCNYTFTIENEYGGRQFEVNGVWTQTVPISSELTLH